MKRKIKQEDAIEVIVDFLTETYEQREGVLGAELMRRIDPDQRRHLPGLDQSGKDGDRTAAIPRNRDRSIAGRQS